MKSNIPDCYDPIAQEARRDQEYAEWLMRLPKCLGCGCPTTGETYLDLEPFGIRGVACEKCVETHTHFIENLEVDDE